MIMFETTIAVDFENKDYKGFVCNFPLWVFKYYA